MDCRMPEDNYIEIVFNVVPGKNYCAWFDNIDQAEDWIEHRRTVCGIGYYVPFCYHRTGDHGAFWLVFNLMNGDHRSQRYAWWFNTKAEAKKFRDRSRKMFFSLPEGYSRWQCQCSGCRTFV